ncbi:unnamed protein product [Orchesella dallaii]|uniref:Protein RMD5 A n=1 Tax=Orchesella dallaii TaxID=48710 RepID=A0ABP1R7S4_9HEXA
MEGSRAVERALNNLTCGLQDVRDVSADEELKHHQFVLTEILTNLLERKSDDEELDEDEIQTIYDAVKGAMKSASDLPVKHRQKHLQVSKVGKAIDKNFCHVGVGPLSQQPVFKSGADKEAMTQVISQHLYREGMPQVGDKLCQESGVTSGLDPKILDAFKKMNVVLEALKSRNLEPALKWVDENRETLLGQGSTLEFQLYRLAFVCLIKNGNGTETDVVTAGMQFSRRHFPRFAKRHEKEIQKLMGALLLCTSAGGIQSSPYAYLFHDQMWDDVINLFNRDVCNLIGVSIESPLQTCCSAGCVAFPILLEASHAMTLARQGQSQGEGGRAVWHGRNELPVELNLGKEFHFHSIFSCPILRQQGSESNPPMRLNCGHVISRDAVHKLMNGPRFRCPYCTGAQHLLHAKQINF